MRRPVTALERQGQMDPVEVDQLLFHRAARKIKPAEVRKHGILDIRVSLTRSKVTGGVGLVLPVAGASCRHQYEALSSTLLFHKFDCHSSNAEVLDLVGQVIDLIVSRTSGQMFQVPVLVCPLHHDHFPLAIISYISKPLMQPVFTGSEKV